jgi:hypothetical protein
MPHPEGEGVRYSTNLILRSERSERLEGWATSEVRDPTLRDAALRAAPQGEVVFSV